MSLGLSPLFFPNRWTHCISALAASPKPWLLLPVTCAPCAKWHMRSSHSPHSPLSQSADLSTFHVFHLPAACLSISTVHLQVIFGCQCFLSPSRANVMAIRQSLLLLLLRESIMNKGWKFLVKKLWCCVGGGNKVIWLYQLSWNCKLATVTSYGWVSVWLMHIHLLVRASSLKVLILALSSTS